mmetsp:Transcript_31153/g.81680  ORF Transcript_31153/g.81680 Transcript_31153/m.81680 type:complete len:569 (+) Transcript_31153:447-2153(+)|eukprot:CAMPEP_0182924172 /NCGR_PEP_ID=MMETSP0105_2-20130417/5884_1 /TAXON_ID=81532 ORGANISM="Acanthoeca-like sp., Strain 10tr" /NCGR_SAMPLE_ID=MMETSP0105_2 /ASSEMBLY_ACC=CAM_ASM_000205 /LENGTH=568 /DNA_ID=CAMNT_0025061929 /DNA_START=401 /DNA_END=2104 /DNA_ORIENTATION=-
MSRVDVVNSLEFGATYIAAENDTPKIVADKMEVEVRHLVQMNKERLPGLFAKSRLKAGTELVLPYDGLVEEDGLAQLLKMDKPPARKPTKETMLSLYRALKKLDAEKIFMHPVTDEEAPMYSKLILRPMSWSQIRKKLDGEAYASIIDLAVDFALVCKNAIVYNDTDTKYHQTARKLLADGMDVIEHYQWSETMSVTKVPGDDESTEPYARYSRKTGPTTTSVDPYPNSTFLQAVPRVGQYYDVPVQVPVPEVEALKRSQVIQVTPLRPSPWFSFAPRYDGANATVEPGPFEPAEVDPAAPEKHYTDYTALAKASVVPHAAAMARIAAKMSVGSEERLRVVKRIAAMDPADLADPSAAPSTGTPASAKAAVDAATASAGAVTAATPAEGGDSGGLAATLRSNNDLLAQLQLLQRRRLAGPTPTVTTAEERDLAAQFRSQTETLLKALKPEDVVPKSVARKMLGVEIVDPRVAQAQPDRKRRRDFDDGDSMEKGIHHMTRLWRSAQKMQRLHFQHELKGQITCDNCKGTGIRWTLELPQATGSILCHACGLYLASFGKPRPAAFGSVDE